MKFPRKYKAIDIKHWNDDRQLEDGRWVPARPIYYCSLIDRIKLVYHVFIGKCDVLDWEE